MASISTFDLRRTAMAAVLVAGLLLSGCGDDESTDTGGTDTSADGGGATTTEGDGGGGGGDDAACPADNEVIVSAVSGEDAAAGDDYGMFEGFAGREESPLEVVDPVAISLADGKGLTIYLADFPIEDPATATVTAPEGKTAIAIFLTVFSDGTANPDDIKVLEAGDVIPAKKGDSTDIGGTTHVMGALFDFGGELYNSDMAPDGEATILYLDDEKACFELEYTDYVSKEGPGAEIVAKHVKATFSATIVDSMF